MGIGVKMEHIVCDEETTSGRNKRIRDRRRRWGSDELALFAAMHDATTGELLAPYRIAKSDVDSGEQIDVGHSILAPTDSADAIVMSLVGYELDGAGSVSSLAADKYSDWLDAVSDSDFGLELGPETIDTVEGIFFVPLQIPLWKRMVADDLIILDRFVVNRSAVAGSGTPDPERYEPSAAAEGLSVAANFERRDGDLHTSRTYRARKELSTYTVTMSFRL